MGLLDEDAIAASVMQELGFDESDTAPAEQIGRAHV